MKTKISIFLISIFANCYAGGCTPMVNYYNSLDVYLQSCKLIGQMPYIYAEPHPNTPPPTPLTDATVSKCMLLLENLHMAGSLIQAPGSPLDTSCLYTQETLTAKYSVYNSSMNNNNIVISDTGTYYLPNPCLDTFMVNPAFQEQLKDMNNIMIGPICKLQGLPSL